ncbi:MAG: response regulator transcription factor [Balneolales bacterium]|nr:response regulator transcription factor [Balneolales bacterium]
MNSVFICEDHQIVIDGIEHILQKSGQYGPVSSCKTVGALLEALKSESPRVLILDLNLPDQNSLDHIAEIRRSHPNTAILILTMHNDPLLAEKVRREGADGFLLKDFGESELLYALNVIMAGDYYNNPKIKHVCSGSSDAKALFLTKREKQIIRETAIGSSSSAIASNLYISKHTVNTHRRNIYKKLNISNIRELITFAYKNGLG